MILSVIEQLNKEAKKSFHDWKKSKRKRLDVDTPLGLKIGSIINFDIIRGIILEDAFKFLPHGAEDISDYECYQMQGEIPEGSFSIIAFSKNIKNEFIHFKFYLEKEAGYIEVICKDNKIIDDGLFFYSLNNELIPNSETLDHYRPNPDPDIKKDQFWWIGNIQYPLNGQLIDDEETWRCFAYQRYWGFEYLDLIKPEEFSEEIYFDPFGDNILSISHCCMLNFRYPTSIIQDEIKPDENIPMEYCFVTMQTSSEGLSIDDYIGYSISEADFEVI